MIPSANPPPPPRLSDNQSNPLFSIFLPSPLIYSILAPFFHLHTPSPKCPLFLSPYFLSFLPPSPPESSTPSPHLLTPLLSSSLPFPSGDVPFLLIPSHQDSFFVSLKFTFFPPHCILLSLPCHSSSHFHLFFPPHPLPILYETYFPFIVPPPHSSHPLLWFHFSFFFSWLCLYSQQLQVRPWSHPPQDDRFRICASKYSDPIRHLFVNEAKAAE
jgi:hypothetical protein